MRVVFGLMVGILMSYGSVYAAETATKEQAVESVSPAAGAQAEAPARAETPAQESQPAAEAAATPEVAAPATAPAAAPGAETVAQSAAPSPEAAPAPAPSEQPASTPVAETPAQPAAPSPEAVPASAPSEQPASTPVAEAPAVTTQAPTEAAPAAAAPAATAPAPAAEEEIKGIDTVNLEEPQGNWLFKRIYWEKAQNKYEQIKMLVDTIFEKKMLFFEKNRDIDRNVFDPFYLSVGMDQGRLNEIIDYYTVRMKELRDKGEALSMDERSLLDTLQNDQTSLEQLAKDVGVIGAYDDQIGKVLQTLLDQLNQIRKFEHDAWNDFKAISQVLSDKKAQELYNKIDMVWKNILQVQDYINGPLTQHFEQLEGRVKDYTERIKAAFATLKEKGVDLKKQAEQLEAEREGRAVAPVKPVEEDEEEPAPTRGWFSWVGDLWSGFTELIFGSGEAAPASSERGWFSWMGDWWRGVTGWLTGSSTPAVAAEQESAEPDNQEPSAEQKA